MENNKLQFHAVFDGLNGPLKRSGGGFTVKFDVAEIHWPQIAPLPALQERNLLITIEVLGEGADIPLDEPAEKTQREKDMAHSSILIKKLGLDQESKEAYMEELFGKGIKSRTQLDDLALSRFVHELAVLAGDRPPHPAEVGQ